MKTWRTRKFWKLVSPRPSVKRSPMRNIAKRWPNLDRIQLTFTISDIAQAESRASGPARARLRARRLRAADVMAQRFGVNSFVRDYSGKRLPWEV